MAEHLGAFRGDGIRREHVVERVLDALQPHVVHPDEAQHVGRQLPLGVEARLFRLQVDAAQFAALARRAYGCRPVGRNVALDVHEAFAVEQAPHLLRVQVQDVGEQRRRPGRVGDRGRPRGDRVALDGDREHASVAVQDRTALHVRKPHHGIAGRVAVDDHERGVADNQRRHAEHQERHEHNQPPGGQVASGRLRRWHVRGTAHVRFIGCRGCAVDSRRQPC